MAAVLALSGCKGGGEAAATASKGDAKGGAAKGDGTGRGGAGGGGGRGAGGAGGGGGRGLRASFPVRTISIERMSFQREVDFSGNLLSQDQVRVSAEASGMVREVLVELGQEVKAGQIMVQIEPRELQLALERAESALRQTEAQLGIITPGGTPPGDDQVASVRTAMANRDDAKSQLARSQELQAKGLAPKADLDTVQTRVKVTEAQYQASIDTVRSLRASLQDRRASYELAKKKLDDAQVRAPVSGAISDRPVQRGEFIRENSIVATIVQLNPLKLRSAVQEKNAQLIRPGLGVKFSVESYPDQVFDGKIRFISPAIDQLTRTFTIEIVVDNTARKLKPGFFAKGTIQTHKDDNVMAVPDESIVMLAGVASVYTVDGQGEVRQKNIQLGETEGKFHEVIGGLEGTEKLAASNLNQLVSGMIIGGGEGGGGGRGGGGRGGRGGRGGSEGGGAIGAGGGPAVAAPDAPAAGAPATAAPAGEERGGGERRGGRRGGRGGPPNGEKRGGGIQ